MCYQPILVDLDCCTNVKNKKVKYGCSCMYAEGKTVEQIDWIQLGWLIDWVLT